MRMGTFSGSLVYGVVAALGAIPYLMVTRPIFGASTSLATCYMVAVVVYVIAIAPGWSRGIRIGALAAALGTGIVLLAPGPTVALAGALVLLGLMRSGFLFRAKPARALLIELAVLGGGLALAYGLAGAGPLSLALAIWGFFLVQSTYFLLGGVRQREEPKTKMDPFEQACQQASRLMDDFAV